MHKFHKLHQEAPYKSLSHRGLLYVLDRKVSTNNRRLEESLEKGLVLEK